MRLEPVYLVAPKPKPPSMPTRRALLMAGGAFVLGSGLGGACGYAAGVARGGVSSTEDAALDEVAPSGDAELDELRRLATKAPIEELMANALVFANLVRSTYVDDKVLWQGMERIGSAIVSGFEMPDRRKSAVWVAQVIESSNSHFADPLRQLAEQLRQVR